MGLFLVLKANYAIYLDRSDISSTNGHDNLAPTVTWASHRWPIIIHILFLGLWDGHGPIDKGKFQLCYGTDCNLDYNIDLISASLKPAHEQTYLECLRLDNTKKCKLTRPSYRSTWIQFANLQLRLAL